MSGLACANYGAVEEAATKTAVAASLPFVDKRHIGDTACSDVARRLGGDAAAARRDGGDARALTSSAEVSFDISISSTDITDDALSSGADLSTAVSSSLDVAISSGNLTSALAAAAAAHAANSTNSTGNYTSAFASVSVTGHSVATFSPSAAPTPEPTRAPTPAPSVPRPAPTSMPTTAAPTTSKKSTTTKEGVAVWAYGVVGVLLGGLVMLLVNVARQQCEAGAENKKGRYVYPDDPTRGGDADDGGEAGGEAGGDALFAPTEIGEELPLDKEKDEKGGEAALTSPRYSERDNESLESVDASTATPLPANRHVIVSERTPSPTNAWATPEKAPHGEFKVEDGGGSPYEHLYVDQRGLPRARLPDGVDTDLIGGAGGGGNRPALLRRDTLGRIRHAVPAAEPQPELVAQTTGEAETKSGSGGARQDAAVADAPAPAPIAAAANGAQPKKKKHAIVAKRDNQ